MHDVAYVLMQHVPYEGGYLYGVYSTLELAEAARAALSDPYSDAYSFGEMSIHHVDVDAAPGEVGLE